MKALIGGLISGIIIIILVIALAIVTFKAKRYLNYKRYYQIAVQEEINKAMQQHILQYHTVDKIDQVSHANIASNKH